MEAEDEYEQIYGQAKQESDRPDAQEQNQVQPEGEEGADYDIYDDEDDEDIPNIILDPDRLDTPTAGGTGTATTPTGFSRTGLRTSGAGVGRVNMTWSKADGSKPKTKPKKNPFEIDIEGLEDKPWRKPNVDITDYFNYGFTEDTWKAYCQKQVQLRNEQAMQGKIRVWEGPTKNEQKFPDIPAELLSGESGIKQENAGNGPPFMSKPDFMHRPRPVQTFEGFEQQRHRPRGREQDESVIQILSGDNEHDSGTGDTVIELGENDNGTDDGEQDAMFHGGPGMPPRDFRQQPGRPGFYGKDNFQNFRGPFPPFRGPFPPRFPPGGAFPGSAPFRDRRDDRMGGPRFGGRGFDRDRPFPGPQSPEEQRAERSPSRDDRPKEDQERDPGRSRRDRDRDRDRERDRDRDDKKSEKRRRSSERDTKSQKEDSSKHGSERSSKDEGRSSRDSRSESRRRDDNEGSRKRSRSKETKRESEEDRKRRR